MTLEKAIELYKKLESDTASQNFFAQANARYILFGVKESQFPSFRENLNFGSDSLAFSYLSIGCTFYENKKRDIDMRKALEKAATFIEYNHFHEQNRTQFSLYYLLISGLAYYASSQYSKAFVIMKKVDADYQTDISILTSAFLKKNFQQVNQVLNKILLDDDYLKDNDVEQISDDKIQIVLYARAFANLIDFLFSGNISSLENTIEILEDLSELLLIDNEPSMWWVVRLLKIVAENLQESSLWTTILPRIPDNEEKITTAFINSLLYAKNSTVELFNVQRNSLDKVLSTHGAVLSLPTSSGKTRISEIAILQNLIEKPNTKILFLAPFRSLAYELENSLNKTFKNIGYKVTQLYGSGQFSQLDKVMIENAHILITTPEKAKVILRANDEIVNQIGLVIIDEGHLLDTDERQVKNEFFIEELKKYVDKNRGKIILLSAVLPNAEDIAEWITSDCTSYVSDSERVARQRLGILKFANSKVDLEWFGDEKPFKIRQGFSSSISNNSFNSNFILPIELRKKRKSSVKYPESKKQAIALVSLKLGEQKPLLIFVGKANYVISQASEIYEAMKITNQLYEHNWKNVTDWETLKLLCEENTSKENEKILEFAKFGILCHKSAINQDIKLAIEKLMRLGNPKFIVGTKTLGQGVNLGISTIIIANADYGYDNKKLYIKNNEFWNIVGRAGRSFIDTEGKILFTVTNNEDEQRALNYYNNKPENAQSGLLEMISRISKIAQKCQVSFSELLFIIAENNFIKIETNYNKSKDYEDFFELIDDTLLAIYLQFIDTPEDIDNYFRKTLAFIQVKYYQNLSQENVIAFLKARIKSITGKLVPDSSKWQMLVSSGLPLHSAIKLDTILDEIIAYATDYLETKKSIEDKVQLLINIEAAMSRMPSNAFCHDFIEEEIGKVREVWLSGKSLKLVEEISKCSRICSDYFGYKVSWFLGAIVTRCKKLELVEIASIYEELAICCELGLPDLMSCKIFLAGIRSRRASIMVSKAYLTMQKEYSFMFLSNVDSSITEIENIIHENLDLLKTKINDSSTNEWLNIFKENYSNYTASTTNILYNLPNELINITDSKRVFVKKYQDDFFLCDSVYNIKLIIKSIEREKLETIADRNNIFYEFVNGNWSLTKK